MLADAVAAVPAAEAVVPAAAVPEAHSCLLPVPRHPVLMLLHLLVEHPQLAAAAAGAAAYVACAEVVLALLQGSNLPALLPASPTLLAML